MIDARRIDSPGHLDDKYVRTRWNGANEGRACVARARRTEPRRSVVRPLK